MDFFNKFIELFGSKESKKRQLQNHKREFFNEIRKIEGATKSDRYKYWNLNGIFLVSGKLLGLEILSTRSRDLVKNDGYSKRGIISIESNTIGTGITGEIVSKKDNKPLKDIQNIWDEFTESNG
ncbi:hypothetical protein [Pigmentibacter ruber]|uniref:hypothetical protein n=1 Tax=Pigmentibacter ruber TaxID=2683196 RepID=UPI00131DD2C1|nr:hypothetical protein [Pigmentibacter ruber]